MLSNGGLSGLRAKSLLITCLLGLSIAAFLFLFTLPKQQQWITSWFSQSASQALDQMSASITSPLLSQQYAELYESLDAQLQQRPEWKNILVVGDAGEQLYPLEDISAEMQSGDVEFLRDISVGGRTLATIRLTANFNAAVEQGNRLQFQLAGLQLLTLGVIFLMIIWLIDRRITAPLKQLISAFRGLSNEQFDVPLKPVHSGEIGRVVSEFEKMRETLQLSQRRLHQLKNEAELANRAKSDFVSHVSHELRTPLNAILGLTELSRVEPSISEQQRDYANSIYLAGSHLRTLVDDILDLGAIESSNLKLELESVSVLEVVQECVALTSVTAKAAEVTVTYDDEKLHPLWVRGDFKRIKQVLLNLLSNGIKYNAEGGSVTVSAEKSAAGITEITVADTGVGLTSEQLDKLFTPFDRLGAELRDKQGTGIGLVITKNLVALMHGSIRVESESGVGSCFYIGMPTAQPSETAGAETAPGARRDKNHQPSTKQAANIPPVKAEARPLRILVAEDSATNRQIISYQLKALGYEAEFANDGVLALELLDKQDFDVLLTDVKMPRMDGPELAAEIRRKEAGISTVDTQHQALQIFAVTANVMAEDKRSYLAVGMNGVLAKPIELAALKSLLESVPLKV